MKNLFLGLITLGLAISAHAVEEVSAGHYQALLGDCAACHTTDVSQPLAGGMAFPTPFGDVYSTNITPDPTYGIGRYSLEDFIKVMRQGVTLEGHNLYPAMPYTSYAKMSDTDLEALYRYLMDEVTAQQVENKAADIPWPFSMRWPLAVWNWMFHDDRTFVADAEQSEEWNRGAYLVQGATHCGTCHTPRGLAMQEKSLDGSAESYLSGAGLAGWYAGNIRGDMYSQEELVELLKTGRSHTQAVLGPMAEVVTYSSQYFTDEDLNAIVTYVRSLSYQQPAPAKKVATITEAAQDDYKMYCSTCHGRDGQGREQIIPSLAGNTTVLADNPASLINVLLHGGKTAITQIHIGYDMPGYAWKFDDQRAAELVNLMRASWGNQATAVSAAEIKAQR